MPADWFQKWRIWDDIEPIGGARGDLQAAYVGAAAMAPWSKRPRAPRAGDFLPSMRAVAGQQVQSPASQKAVFAAAKRGFARARARRQKREGLDG